MIGKIPGNPPKKNHGKGTLTKKDLRPSAPHQGDGSFQPSHRKLLRHPPRPQLSWTWIYPPG